MYALFLLASLLGAGKSWDPHPGEEVPRSVHLPQNGLCRAWPLCSPCPSWQGGARTAQARSLAFSGRLGAAGGGLRKCPREDGPGPGQHLLRGSSGFLRGWGPEAFPQAALPTVGVGESCRVTPWAAVLCLCWAHVIEVGWSPVPQDTSAVGFSCLFVRVAKLQEAHVYHLY